MTDEQSVGRWPPTPLPEPTAVGAGFVLRSWQPDDAPALASAWRDDEIERWTNPPSGDVADAERWIRNEAKRRATGVAIDAVIVYGGAVAGEVGLSGFASRVATAAVGYWVGPEFRGRGLAAMATESLLGWAAGAIGLRTVVATTAADNVASIATLVRVGFGQLGVAANGELVYGRDL